MKSRLLALGMMFILIAALVPGVMAQDTAPMICGNLSTDDCTALTTAFTKAGAAGSGAFTLSVAADVQSDDPAQAVKLGVTADGKFSGMTPMSMSMTDVTAISADPAAAVAKIIEGLKTFSGELNLTANLPASAASMTNGEPLVVNLLLVNGVGYLDFSKLPAALTAAAETPKGWAGLDLIDVLTNIAPSLKPTTSSTASSDLSKAQAIVAKYLEYTRDGDTFTGELDVVGLVGDADFQAMTNMKPTAAETASIAALKDVTFEVVFTLDGDKLSEAQLTIDVPESTITALNAASPSPSSVTSKPPKSINVSLDFKLSGLGEAQTIAAPADAPVTKFMELMTKVSAIYSKMVQGLNTK